MFALAQTGSGKTFAYGLPLLQMIETKQPQIQCVIVVPTRELARQIHQDLSPIAAELKIKSANLFGGIDLTVQTSQLENLPHMVIATPGRLLALLNAKTLDLSAVKHLVFDEVDRLLDMGFWTDIQSIIKDIPPNDKSCASPPRSLMRWRKK